MKKDKNTNNNNNGYVKYTCIAFIILGVIMGLMASAEYTPGGLVVVLIAAPLMACAYFISKAKAEKNEENNEPEENNDADDNNDKNA